MFGIAFIKTDVRDEAGDYVADFGIDDSGQEFFGYRGMHYAYWLTAHPFIRKSFVYIVRQHDMWRTFRVLCHELTHAAIWLLHLPPKWSKALDGIKEA